MNKLNKIIEKMNEEDLLRIQKDLEAGNVHRVVKKKLDEMVVVKFNKVCPICNSPIDEENFTLFFGPKDFRKKASFCAFDCLEYFISQLKEHQLQKQIED
ncbi:MAG: hypothetical protein ABIE94_04260 [archaeon]